MPFILIALGGWLLSLSWNKWTNITLDYGRELYTPWLITRGQVLYKDILTIHGPFPSYFNALLFKVFGTSLMTLVLFNILLVAVITTLIYRFFIYTTDKRAAFFASAVFLSIFAFSESSRGRAISPTFVRIPILSPMPLSSPYGPLNCSLPGSPKTFPGLPWVS